MEIGIRRAQNTKADLSDKELKREYGVRVGLNYLKQVDVREIPSDCIERVVVNPLAQQLLHPEVSYLASEEFLRSRAVMTVPGVENTGILTPHHMGRAIPTDYGVIPYGAFVGSMISAKGVFLSGRHYGFGITEHGGDVKGFQPDNDSEDDIELNNEALLLEARSCLSLGYIVLHTDKVIDWLIDKWQNAGERYATAVENLQEAKDLFKKSGKKPTIEFRVSGSVERCKPSEEVYSTKAKERYRQRRATEMRRSCRNYLREIELDSSSIHRRLGDTVDQTNLVNALDKIANATKNDRMLNADEVITFVDFLVAELALKLHVALKINSKYWPHSSQPRMFHRLPGSSDTDLALFSHDFGDMSPVSPESPDKLLGWFISSARETLTLVTEAIGTEVFAAAGEYLERFTNRYDDSLEKRLFQTVMSKGNELELFKDKWAKFQEEKTK